MLAALHGPIEEQARLSIHAHILLWFVHSQSEQWLRDIVNRSTDDIRGRLRIWQEKVLAAVQSMQLDSAAVLPVLFAPSPDEAPEPKNTPFSEQQQRDCRMDGELEGDVHNPEKRRPLLATEPLFQDHHHRRHHDMLAPGEDPMPDYLVPQSGAQLCLLPHYRLLKAVTDDDLTSPEGQLREAAAWAGKCSEDYRCNIAVGQMHQHKDTCFKYIVDKALRVAKYCRFNFCHFVHLWLNVCASAITSGSRKQGGPKLVTVARTGKDLVLPRQPGSAEDPDLFPKDPCGDPVALKPTRSLGPTVNTDPDHGKAGLVMPIRWNPLEGSSNAVCQNGLRGNVDYQSMLRTLQQGFRRDFRDDLRDPPLTDAEQALAEQEEQNQFEEDLPDLVQKASQQPRSKGLEDRDPEELEEELRRKRASRLAAHRKLGPGGRFVRSVKSLVVSMMKQSIQAMFYACDYSTKPNMTCAPLLVAIRDGVQRIEETLQREAEEAETAALQVSLAGASPGGQTFSVSGKPKQQLTKLQDEARRRLIRQATAANQAIVKGNCLRVMQLLTGREALRTHFSWQLMMKNAMWMAFECRRVQQGFDEREEAAGAVQVDAAEVSSTASECSAEEFDSDAD